LAISTKAIFDMSDEMIKTIIRANAPVTALSQNDMLNELDRRASRRQAMASAVLGGLGLAIAVVALIVTALKP
jgi:hypothetical protein